MQGQKAKRNYPNFTTKHSFTETGKSVHITAQFTIVTNSIQCKSSVQKFFSCKIYFHILNPQKRKETKNLGDYFLRDNFLLLIIFVRITQCQVQGTTKKCIFFLFMAITAT